MSTFNRVNTLSILALTLLWSATSVQAEEATSDKADNLSPQTSTVNFASDATAEAAADAAASIAEDTAVDLDLLRTDLTLAVDKAPPITIAANYKSSCDRPGSPPPPVPAIGH